MRYLVKFGLLPERITARYLTRAAIIAAIYAVLTAVFANTSFGAVNGVQVRVSEALTLLPVLTPVAIPGLFVGCVLANWVGVGLGASIPLDALLGPFATLFAAILTRLLRDCPLLPELRGSGRLAGFSRALRKWPVVAALAPVVVNALYVGWLLSVFILKTPFWINAALTAIGEFIACFVFGFPLLWAMRTKAGRFFEL